MHACNDGWWICVLTTCTYLLTLFSLEMNIDNITDSACLFFNPLTGCVVQFSDLASLMLMSMDSVSYIHCPNTVAANKYIGFEKAADLLTMLQNTTALGRIHGSSCWLTLASWTKFCFFSDNSFCLLHLHYGQEKPNWLDDPLSIMLCYLRSLR